jgi:hypothetical protein
MAKVCGGAGRASAAPGDIARGALRQNFTENLWISVSNSDRCTSKCPYRLVIETFIQTSGSRSNKWCYFTLHFSCLEIERGRLGEVVSLVGDCRPPPPGNPRQPTPPASNDIGWNGLWNRPAHATTGGNIFTAKDKNIGGDFLTVSKHCSFNNYQITNNLKILNKSQYFKNTCSYFSCMRKKHVLEFVHLHSHLCGLKVVEPPSIAITNVLNN